MENVTSIEMRSRRATETEKILKWRTIVEKMCSKCEAQIQAFELEDASGMTVQQARKIVIWAVLFVRFKYNLLESFSKRKHNPLSFSFDAVEAIDEIKHAIKHGQKKILEPHLFAAIRILQRHKKNPNDPSLLHSYAEEGISTTDTGSSNDTSESSAPSDPAALEKKHKEEEAKRKKERMQYLKQKLKANFLKTLYEYQKSNPLYKEQKKVDRVIDRLKDLEESALSKSAVYAKGLYAHIQNNHAAMDIWLKIVKAAYALAIKRVDEFLEKVKASEEKRERIRSSLMKGFVTLAMSPFLLNNLVDPATQIFNSIFEQLGGVAVDFTDTDTPNNIYSELQNQFFIFLSLIGRSETSHEKSVKKIDEMREKNPVEFMELMQQFSDYKLNGIAKEMSQAFDPNAKVWDGLTSEEVIHAQRIKIMREIQASATEEEWHDYKKNQFTQLFDDIKTDLQKNFKNVSTSMFDEIYKQYPHKNDILQLQEIIKLFSFDESASGLKAVKLNKQNELISAMAEVIEKHITLTYAVLYDPFFSADDKKIEKNIALVNDRKYDPYENSYFALRPDEHAKAILDHLIEKIPEKKEKLEPLKNVGFPEYAYDLWVLGTTPKQKARQDVLNELIQEYVNIDLNAKLKDEVFKFAQKNKIVLPENIKASVQNEWVSEQKLREHAQKLTGPLIQEATQYKALHIRQCQVVRHILDVKDLLNNKTVEQVPDPGRLLKV